MMLRSAKSGGRRFDNAKINLLANVVFLSMLLLVVLLPSLGDFCKGYFSYGYRVSVRFISKARNRVIRVGVIRLRVIRVRFSNL